MWTVVGLFTALNPCRLHNCCSQERHRPTLMFLAIKSHYYLAHFTEHVKSLWCFFSLTIYSDTFLQLDFLPARRWKTPTTTVGVKLRQRQAQTPTRPLRKTRARDTRGRRNWHLHKSAQTPDIQSSEGKSRQEFQSKIDSIMNFNCIQLKEQKCKIPLAGCEEQTHMSSIHPPLLHCGLLVVVCTLDWTAEEEWSSHTVSPPLYLKSQTVGERVTLHIIQQDNMNNSRTTISGKICKGENC